MSVQHLGDGAIRIPRPPGKDGGAILDAVRAWPGVVDVALTDAWVGVQFRDAPRVDPARIAALDALPSATPSARVHEIAVRYDGADLDDVARASSLSVPELVRAHSHAEYTVLFLGFQPGFAYLGGLPHGLEVPRLASPRPRVPKNAVAIAGAYAGIYPFESPGGWRLLGTGEGVTLFDPAQGALLRAGDRVRFRVIG